MRTKERVLIEIIYNNEKTGIFIPFNIPKRQSGNPLFASVSEISHLYKSINKNNIKITDRDSIKSTVDKYFSREYVDFDENDNYDYYSTYNIDTGDISLYDENKDKIISETSFGRLKQFINYPKSATRDYIASINLSDSELKYNISLQYYTFPHKLPDFFKVINQVVLGFLQENEIEKDIKDFSKEDFQNLTSYVNSSLRYYATLTLNKNTEQNRKKYRYNVYIDNENKQIKTYFNQVIFKQEEACSMKI